MAPALRQKKLKLELTFTVNMAEIESDFPHPSLARRLQQALLNDETALTRLMVGAMLNELHGYADYLADQDSLPMLKEAAQALPSGDPQLPISDFAFAQETSPLRITCMNARLESSAIQEQVNPGNGECAWHTVWRDLRPDSALGLLFEQLAIPTTPIPFSKPRDAAHALRARYLNQQQDGIHVEGRCACQQPFEGIGADAGEALDDLWRHFKAHRDATSLASKFQTGWKTRLKPGKQ
ncbi:MAG: hypothetical protein EHM21_04160 [Chloroflexi bacterium]|nr:MAG: hypothetical protein EHM21_04160 [Chloroflexota bacterium]